MQNPSLGEADAGAARISAVDRSAMSAVVTMTLPERTTAGRGPFGSRPAVDHFRPRLPPRERTDNALFHAPPGATSVRWRFPGPQVPVRAPWGGVRRWP